jgi:hypothetical protein
LGRTFGRGPCQLGRKLVEFGAVGIAFGHGNFTFISRSGARHRHHTPVTDRIRTASEYRSALTCTSSAKLRSVKSAPIQREIRAQLRLSVLVPRKRLQLARYIRERLGAPARS